MRELSNRMLEMKESSVRKLTKYGNAAEAAGKYVYKLNIGQPDLKTPVEYYRRVRNFDDPVIEYMPSNGTQKLIGAVEKFYRETGINIKKNHIAVTTGGSEAMLFALLAIANPGDEAIVWSRIIRTTVRSSPSQE